MTQNLQKQLLKNSYKPRISNENSHLNTIDTDLYLGGAVELQQPPTALKAGLDSVLLAASVPLKPNQNILDLGSGCFQIGIFLLAREQLVQVYGVEMQTPLISFGHTNIEKADALDRCTQLNANILDDTLANVPSNHFDHVVSNPPYFSKLKPDLANVRHPKVDFHDPTHPNSALERAYARQFEEENAGSHLATWISLAKLKLKQKGRLTLSLSDRQLISVLPYLRKTGFGCIETLPLFPNAQKPASRFLVSAIKGSNSPNHTYGGLILRDHKKAITPRVSQLAMKPTGVSWSEL